MLGLFFNNKIDIKKNKRTKKLPLMILNIYHQFITSTILTSKIRLDFGGIPLTPLSP